EGVGTATITAAFSGKTGSTDITVSGAVLDLIEVTPTAPSIANGTSLQLAATGIYSDGTKQDLTAQASWSSSDNAVSTVANTGVATGAALGTATISADFDGKTGSTSLTVTAATLVSIEVAPVNPFIANGTSVQLAATGIFTDSTAQDLTAQVSWSSSDDLIATVSNAAGSEGLAAGVA